MKKIFITGLVILLPLTLTIVIVSFIFNTLTAPFAGAINTIFQQAHILNKGFLFFSASQVEYFLSQVLILILIFLFTLSLGALARWFFLSYIIQCTEKVVQRIPFISSIYKTSQDVIKTIFTGDNQSFKQVVLVPFPNETTYSIGLLTGDNLPGLEKTPFQDVVSVFVPTTPNPTSGFLMLFQEKDITYLDMTVEEALKFTISCGVIMAPFKTVSKEQLQQAISDRIKLRTPKSS